MAEDPKMSVQGPVVDEATGTRSYTVTEAGHTIHFSIEPEKTNGNSTWSVNLEGVPEPGIIHQEPWTTPDMARDAALRAVHAMLDIEMIRDEVEDDIDPGESDSCIDDTGGRI